MLNAKDENLVKLGAVEKHENREISLDVFEWQDMRQDSEQRRDGERTELLEGECKVFWNWKILLGQYGMADRGDGSFAF